MPRLNSAGSAIMGIGGLTLSIDGSVPPLFAGIQSGGWDWFSDTVAFGQADFGSGFKSYTYTVATPATPPVQVAAAGGNFTAAGGSVWARFLAGSGVFTSYGGWYLLAALADVSPAGQVVLVQNYQAGRGIQVYDSSGTLLLTLDVQINPAGNICLRGDILTYRDSTGWHLVQVSTGQPIGFTARTESINWMVPVTLTGGKVALVERSERLTIRLKDSVIGYVLEPNPVTFNPDGIQYSAGIAQVAWSTTSGEGSGNLVENRITLSDGTLSRGVVSGGAVVWSARPKLPTTSLPGTPVGPAGEGDGVGPLGALLEGIYRQPMVETSRIVTRPWYLLFLQVIKTISEPTLATNIAGVLGPTQGGTGVTTGLTALNANNLTMGNLPIARFNNGDNASASTVFSGDGEFGAWIPVSGFGGDVTQFGTVTAGDVTIWHADHEIEDGGTPQAFVSGAGYWSELTDGNLTAASLIFASGDTIDVWVPTL